ncbi:MAG TPA: FdtA/QdtA family cupin domain-containing protein [Gemmatimonadaceae bacterium]
MPVAVVRWIQLPNVEDDRGLLTAMEVGRDIPFEVRRVFFLHGVRGARGGHAHRDSHQFLVPVTGHFNVTVSDDRRSSVYDLRDPHRGLYVPPMHWVDLDGFSSGAVCLVLTDTPFDEQDYLRDRETFVEASRARGTER